MRRKKEARKNARKHRIDTNNDTVTGNTVELARSDGGVPDPAAVIELDRQSISRDNNMSSVFADRIDDASGMPDFREYIDQEPNEYSEIRVKFFNAEGLSREPKARAYEHIMEKNTIVMVVDTRMTEDKLQYLKQLAEEKDKWIFAEKNRNHAHTAGTLICLPKK